MAWEPPTVTVSIPSPWPQRRRRGSHEALSQNSARTLSWSDEDTLSIGPPEREKGRFPKSAT